jgi:hypothetical protein
MLSKFQLGVIKKANDDSLSNFVERLLDAIVLNARSNPHRTEDFILGLDCSLIQMKTLSLLVLAKLCYAGALSKEQLTATLRKLRTSVQKFELKPISHSEFDVTNGNPAAIVGIWISKENWDLAASYGHILLLATIIERFQLTESHVFSSDHSTLQLMMEVLLYCGQMRDWMLGKLVQSQVKKCLLEFAFSSLNSSVSVLTTSLGMVQKFLDLNSQSQSPKDTQVILGPLLVCLVHPEKSIRAASIGLLVALKQSLNSYSIIFGDKLTKSSIYGFGKFFGGVGSSMEYLKITTAIEFVASLIERGHDIIADGNYLSLNFNHVLRSLSNSKY